MDNLNLNKKQQERLVDRDTLMRTELSEIIEDVAWMDAICLLIEEHQYNGINDGIKA